MSTTFYELKQGTFRMEATITAEQRRMLRDLTKARGENLRDVLGDAIEGLHREEFDNGTS